MKILTARHKKIIDDSYKVFIEKGVINQLPKLLKKINLGQKYALITDSRTTKIHGITIAKFLNKNGVKTEIFSFESGEKSKTLGTIESLAEAMVEKGFNRKDAIIALGGGVVGDIAGFLASIFLRGIPFVQIPTTLLAMVDSAIGGKTGVDLKTGKNLLGTITQPKAVFIDINLLKTLPENQIRNGLGEIIKYGVIKDEKFFSYLEKNLAKVFAQDEKVLNYIIQKSIAIKVEVVENDEKESKNRMILNYGHTYGHALETMSNYTLLHGYAISIGMVIANEMAVEKKLLKQKDADRIKALLEKAELPVYSMQKPTIKDLMTDKKSDGKSINFILPTKVGNAIIYNQKI
jgi:3-dehydroquinate synthase